jgi:DNA-directed RNA polymerase subunit omega
MMDMLALLPENSKNRYDSRHRLVIAASQRAKQIMQGSRPTISTKFTKETTVAIDEMVQGRLEFLTGTQAENGKVSSNGLPRQAPRLERMLARLRKN